MNSNYLENYKTTDENKINSDVLPNIKKRHRKIKKNLDNIEFNSEVFEDFNCSDLEVTDDI